MLTGMDKPYSRSGDGHYAKTANFLTGLHVRKTTGQDLNSGGVSVDQVAAGRLGHLTPLPSLELATDPVINGLDRAGVTVDRKIMADLAVNDPAAFTALVQQATAALAA